MLGLGLGLGRTAQDIECMHVCIVFMAVPVDEHIIAIALEAMAVIDHNVLHRLQTVDYQLHKKTKTTTDRQTDR